MKLTIEVDSLDELAELRDALNSIEFKPKLGRDDEITALGMTVYTTHALNRGGIFTIKDLLPHNEISLIKMPTIGKKGLKEIVESLRRFGLRLSTNTMAPRNGATDSNGIQGSKKMEVEY